MAMSITEMAWGTSLTAVTMYDNISPGLRPWTNWADVHSDFGRIDSYRLFMVPHSLLKQIFIMWWAIPVSAYIFFLFFAFGEETVRDYKRAYAWVKNNVFKRPEFFKKVQFRSLNGSDRFVVTICTLLLSSTDYVFSSLPPQLVVHKHATIDVKSDCNDDTLPQYTPRPPNSAPFITPTSSKFPSSFSSYPSSPTSTLPATVDFSKDFKDIDLEKNMDFITVQFQQSHHDSRILALESPLTPQTPYSVTSHISALSRDSRISISDEFPPSRPPTPPLPPALVTRERQPQEWRLSTQRSPTSRRLSMPTSLRR